MIPLPQLARLMSANKTDLVIRDTGGSYLVLRDSYRNKQKWILPISIMKCKSNQELSLRPINCVDLRSPTRDQREPQVAEPRDPFETTPRGSEWDV